MQYLQVENLHLRRAEALSPQIKNPQSVTFAEVRKYNKLFKAAYFRICDLRNLFSGRPPLMYCTYTVVLYIALCCMQ